MPHTTAPLSKSRWAYLTNLRPAKPRYLHVSCECGMRPSGDSPFSPLVPWIAPGTTYDVGRNAAKRRARAAR